MSRRDDALSLRHMRDHAVEAAELVRGRARAELDADRVLALALTKLVEIIGEAAGRVSEPTRDAAPGLPWRQIVGTRNRLVHGYDEIDLDVLWEIATVELMPLVEQLDRMLAG